MKINGIEIPLNPSPPQKEGRFLYGSFSGIEILTVRLIPEAFYGGLPFPAYYGVMEYNRRPVSNLKGGFAEIEL